jgi:uncharacterized protein YndB with AHSA1/START domain/DNA-binding transcriptional ArsR family regulator
VSVVKEDVFKALADESRRTLLDALREHDGQSITALAAHLPQMTRFGAASHLAVLVDAGLVTVIRSGREKLHYLNAIPLREVAVRWLSDFSAAHSDLLLAFRTELEEPTRQEHPMIATNQVDRADQAVVYRIPIKAPIQLVWDALTDNDTPRPWMWDTTIASTWRAGESYSMNAGTESMIAGTVLEIEPPLLLSMTFDARWDPETAEEPSGRLEYRLQSLGDAVTELTVILTGLVGRTAADAARDTPAIYAGLKTWLETGSPLFDDAG